MNSNSYLIPITLIFIITILVSCNSQKTEWKGTIEEVDGVTVVNNPKEPIYGEEVFNLEEELVIGVEQNNQSFHFYEIMDIAVDDEENIYVLDREDCNTKIFDKDGKYIKSFGQKGRGPGELIRPFRIFIINDEEIMIDDAPSYNLNFYSLDGTFLNSISTIKPVLLEPSIDSEKNLIGLGWVRNVENPYLELKKFNSKLNYLFTIGTCDAPNPRRFNPFWARIQWVTTQENNIIFGCPREYKLEIYSPDRKLLKIIEKDYSPIMLSQEEIDKELDKLPAGRETDIPKYHSAFNHMTIDTANRIIIQTWERIEASSGYYYDVFDAEGKYLAKIPLQIKPLQWRNHKVYSIVEDEDGYQYIKRYKVTWKI